MEEPEPPVARSCPGAGTRGAPTLTRGGSAQEDRTALQSQHRAEDKDKK